MPDGTGSDGSQPGGGAGGEDGQGGGGENQQQSGSEQGEEGSSGGAGDPKDPQFEFQLPDHITANMPSIVKILFWLAVGIIALFVLWRHGRQLWRALLEILRGLASLFGFSWSFQRQQQEEAEPVSATPAPPRPFSDFPDPFSSGQAGRWDHHQLVYYSFHALEAWPREEGLPRDLHATPIEFVQLLQARRHDLSSDVGQLGQLYSRANYAPGTLPGSCVEEMRAFWHHLPAISTAEPPEPAGAENQ